jgi:hypothetical protein
LASPGESDFRAKRRSRQQIWFSGALLILKTEKTTGDQGFKIASIKIDTAEIEVRLVVHHPVENRGTTTVQPKFVPSCSQSFLTGHRSATAAL